ncbi:MAG: ABC transporter ATP-binding protein, partial [Rhodobacterales bacterium]
MTLIEIRGLTKGYPGVVANDDVSFDIDKGEIHALLGENGAGKSTLVKMIYGLVRPDIGTMTLDGESFAPTEPRASRVKGVAMVFQHFSLFEALSVAENIALGMENPPKTNALSNQIRDVSLKYGLELDPNRLVGDLSVGERQRVEIIRCLLQDPKLLIMDEPTSVLTPQEVDALFTTLRRLRDEGTSILYISHKLEEIKILCNRATILRHGKVIGICIPKNETAKSMAEMMVGSKLKTPQKTVTNFGLPLLIIKNLSLKSTDPFGTSLKNITFNIRAGEVMGVAGVAGNGQDELMLALSGEVLTEGNSIQLENNFIGQSGPVERRLHGLLTAPEERLGHAAAPDMNLSENTLLSGFQRQKL